MAGQRISRARCPDHRMIRARRVMRITGVLAAGLISALVAVGQWIGTSR